MDQWNYERALHHKDSNSNFNVKDVKSKLDRANKRDWITNEVRNVDENFTDEFKKLLHEWDKIKNTKEWTNSSLSNKNSKLGKKRESIKSKYDTNVSIIKNIVDDLRTLAKQQKNSFQKFIDSENEAIREFRRNKDAFCKRFSEERIGLH